MNFYSKAIIYTRAFQLLCSQGLQSSWATWQGHILPAPTPSGMHSLGSMGSPCMGCKKETKARKGRRSPKMPAPAIVEQWEEQHLGCWKPRSYKFRPHVTHMGPMGHELDSPDLFYYWIPSLDIPEPGRINMYIGVLFCSQLRQL